MLLLLKQATSLTLLCTERGTPFHDKSCQGLLNSYTGKRKNTSGARMGGLHLWATHKNNKFHKSFSLWQHRLNKMDMTVLTHLATMRKVALSKGVGWQHSSNPLVFGEEHVDRETERKNDGLKRCSSY